MKLSLFSAGITAALVFGGAAFATSDDDCVKAWTKLHASVEGSVTEVEAGRYFAALKAANKPVTDGRLTKQAFLEYCKNGTFNIAKANGASTGANQ